MSEIQDKTPLFVYGTLRPGASAFHKVRDFVRDFNRASILSGYTMYDLGKFPAMFPNDYANRKITGDLLYFYEEKYVQAFREIARYEGEGWLFERRRGLVYNETRQTMEPAYFYLGIEGSLIVNKSKTLEDWFLRPGVR